VADAHLAVRDYAAGNGYEAAVEIEPACWRRFTGIGGETQWLKPGLSVRITGTDDQGVFADAWFIEVDLGTESQPSLIRKCQQYEAYLASGIEQDQHGAFPLVLWVFASEQPLHGEHRAQTLRAKIARAGRLTSDLYRYATPETLPAVLASTGVTS